MSKTGAIMKREYWVKSIVSKVESNAGEEKKRDKHIFCAILSRIVHLESQGTIAMFVAFL